MDVAQSAIPTNQVRDQLGDRCQKLFQNFLEEFKVDGELKYLADAQDLVRPERNTLFVSFEDIEATNQDLASIIVEEYYRLYPYLCRAVANFAKDRAQVPASKEFYLSLTDVSSRLKVRDLNTLRIGTLLRITGQVVRTHPVHPELVSGTFTCLDCQNVIKDVPQEFKYTQPSTCTNPMCENRAKFMLDLNKSKFVDFQKVRIQETQAELPRGCIPRTVEVVLRAEAVESAQAGDKCDFTGTLIVVPDVASLAAPGARAETSSRTKPTGPGNDQQGVQGLKALGVRDLCYKLAFLACNVSTRNRKYNVSDDVDYEDMTPEQIKQSMTENEWQRVFEMSTDKNLYHHLCQSLFPSIHGHDEVKRGIILMLFGGIAKETEEGTSLRGDINVCVVGDPSTAKSQFLRQVTEFSPRSVYTSGKASSAAGLTAAVVMDEETNDMVIEAGALMLADNGVCCIDEFDKMEQSDQVAIHEAMEQQTISVIKAGIKATLNARTSILAAANPIGGVYDRSRSLKQNIQLSDPIMSRFDLFFILIDECNDLFDYAIAHRIVNLHLLQDDSIQRVYTPEEVKRYITFARQFKPQLTEESSKYLVQEYRQLRQRDAGKKGTSSWRITVRQLESLIRLSEAMARMHCQETVQTKHVKEASRLLSRSIIRVEQPEIALDDDEQPVAADVDMEQDEPQQNGAANGHEAAPTQNGDATQNGDPTQKDSAAQPTVKTSVSYEEYKRIANLFVFYLKKKEAATTDESELGVHRSELIQWYLHEIEDEIDTEAKLIQQQTICDKIITRLVRHDHVLIQLDQTGLQGDVVKEDDPILIVHPNYVTDA